MSMADFSGIRGPIGLVKNALFKSNPEFGLSSQPHSDYLHRFLS